MTPQWAFLFPMSALVFWTFLIALRMFVGRVKAVQTGKLSKKYFTAYVDGQPPTDVIVTQRHFANLFEVPVLFYAGCLASMWMPGSVTGLLMCAWVFVLSRIAHSFFHLGPNRLYPRMASFFIGFFAVVTMWGLLAFNATVLMSGRL